MKKPRNPRRLAAIGVASALVVTGGAVAANAAGVTGGGGGKEAKEHPDKAITGAALGKASAAALAKVGQGKVTETEAGDEESAYQVEVTKDDGTQVDVNLDKDFHVIKTQTDHESKADTGQ
jgi:hypothetical protein